MAIFSITSLSPERASQLSAAIAGVFPNDHYVVTPTNWLIAASGTTCRELSEKLGATKGDKGLVVIIEVSDYFGWAPNPIWSWIKNKWESKVG